MKKHYVIFYSPGSFTSETSSVEIDSWNVEKAKELARGISERHGAIPYGFRFTTRSRGPDDFDSKQTDQSKGFYYLGGKVETIEEVESRNDPEERILRSNMRGNGYDKIIVNTNSWKFTTYFTENDVLLDWNKDE